jgi:hypothetical protein
MQNASCVLHFFLKCKTQPCHLITHLTRLLTHLTRLVILTKRKVPQHNISTMGNGFSSPLDVCGTTSAGVNATSEFQKRRRDWEKESEASMCFLSDLLDWSTLDEDAVAEKSSQPRKHTVKKDKFETFDENGNCIPLKPESTLWYSMYIMHPPLHKPKFFKKFRRRFRLPYHKFLELVDIAKEATDDDGNLYFCR